MARADAGDTFPEIRPSTRAQAIDYLIPRRVGSACSVPRVEGLQRDPSGGSARSLPRLRALSLLQGTIGFDDEISVPGPGGIEVRYTTDIHALDRLDPTDRDGDGTPDRVQAVLRGLEQARALLNGSLELPAPEQMSVTLANLRMGLHGYVVSPASPTAPVAVVLDSGPGGNLDVVRRAAIQAYAHAVALSVSPRFPAGWADALAQWAGLNIDGVADTSTATCLSNRISHLGAGLLAEDRDLAAGNALWLSFLEQAYGLAAVRVTVEELATGSPVTAAIDRALRRSTGDDLALALREFHVWTLLVGERADEHHFSFAAQLQAPGFASTSQGTPALSVQSDPAVGSTGVTQIAIRPEHTSGGLRILFEGDFNASWEADLILVEHDGTRHRLRFDLADSRGESTVPVDRLSEAWLLIRNLGATETPARRYSYSAHHEAGFPFELGGLAASQNLDDGVLIAWETEAEFHLFGFNIVRRRAAGGQAVIVNPVWIPALGDPTEPTSYRYLDRSAEPGVVYTYAIQGITRDGLTSQTEPVTFSPTLRRRSR